MNHSCINWYGGKGSNQQRTLLIKIVSYINNSEKVMFVDVFGGSGIVTINVKNKIKKYNDKNRDLVNLFEILKDKKLSEEFKYILYRTLYSKYLYENASEKVRLSICSDKIDLKRAVNFYIATMQSVNAIGSIKKSGFKSSRKIVRRGMGQAVSSWKRNVDENLPKNIEAFREVEVYNYDFLQCINEFDSENTIFYLDPPYVSDTRINKSVYEHELENNRHRELVEKLLVIEGQAILSGYENKIYEKLENNGWKKEIIKISSPSGNGNRKSEKEECIWYNFVPSMSK